MVSYKETEKLVFDFLMQKRQESGGNWNFSVRKKASKGAEQNFFIGTEKSQYFGFTFWYIPIGFPGSSNDLIDYIISLRNNKWSIWVQFYQTKNPYDENNRIALEFIQQLSKVFAEKAGDFIFTSNPPANKMFYFDIRPKKELKSADLMIEALGELIALTKPVIDQQLTVFNARYPDWPGKPIQNEMFDTDIAKMHERIKRFIDIESRRAKDELPATIEQVLFDEEPAALNTIFYGPPGTGKTFQLLRLYEQYTTRQETQSRDFFLRTLVDKRPFWEILAVILLENKKMIVPKMREHPLVLAKFASTEIQHPSQRLWSSLQIHTVEDCPNVNLNPESRHGVSIFYKEKDSTWRLNDEATFKQEFPELIELLEDYKKGPAKGGIEQRHIFTTCHQSLAYEDFIEGIKPVLDESEQTELNQNLQYQVQKGVFYEACEKAAQLAGYDNLRACLAQSKEEREKTFSTIAGDRDKQFALFLDEVNRANIAAVFGELITLLEADKRLGQPREIIIDKLPYSKKPFGVPPNLYVYGTMNTADRSVEAIDTALRRRFTFQEMAPNPDLISPEAMIWSLMCEFYNKQWDDKIWQQRESQLFEFLQGKVKDGYLDIYKGFWDQYAKDAWDMIEDKTEFTHAMEFSGINLSVLLQTINHRIEMLVDRDHTIGHAYFMHIAVAEEPLSALKETFKNNIIPLLQEYFYGDYAKIGLVLGNNFVEGIRPFAGSKPKWGKGFKLEEGEYKSIYRLKDISEYSTKEFIEIYESGENNTGL